MVQCGVPSTALQKYDIPVSGVSLSACLSYHCNAGYNFKIGKVAGWIFTSEVNFTFFASKNLFFCRNSNCVAAIFYNSSDLTFGTEFSLPVGCICIVSEVANLVQCRVTS